MTPIVITGDSHATVYGNTLKTQYHNKNIVSAPLASAKEFQHDFFSFRNGKLEFLTDSLRENFVKFREHTGVDDIMDCKGRLVLSLGLSAAFFYGSRIWHNRDFGKNADWRKLFISQSVLDQMVMSLQDYVLKFLRFTREQGLLIGVIAAPPVQRRHVIVDQIGRNKVLFLKELFERPARAILAELNCPIIEPDNVTDDDGFLLEKYYGLDWAHGNFDFGELVLKEVDRLRLTSGSSGQSVATQN